MKIANLVLLGAILSVSSSVSAIDLLFPVNFPKFSGFDATINVNGQDTDVTVRMVPDEKGKYQCLPGGCTVGGTEVAGIATFNYNGPAGKATLTDHPANILADLAFSSGSVSISPGLVSPGKFGGTGTIMTGLGNDTLEKGPLKLTVSPCKLVISLKVGKKKFIFKADNLNGVWVGRLTVVSKPFKTREDLTIVPEGDLIPAVPCGSEIPKPPLAVDCGRVFQRVAFLSGPRDENGDPRRAHRLLAAQSG